MKLLHATLKSGKNGKFYVMYCLPQLKKKQTDTQAREVLLCSHSLRPTLCICEEVVHFVSLCSDKTPLSYSSQNEIRVPRDRARQT